jgi:hypothetical protein
LEVLIQEETGIPMARANIMQQFEDYRRFEAWVEDVRTLGKSPMIGRPQEITQDPGQNKDEEQGVTKLPIGQ